MSLTEGPQTPPPKRRRGAALEAALLEAAWDELIDKGYDGFTIESVADRAHTSRAVVYRRWPGKADLVHAAVVWAGAQQRIPVPDTGTLRGDVIELLRQANRARARIGVQMMLQLSGYFAETGTSLAELRSAFLTGHGNVMQEILDRAVARGEVDATRLTPRVTAVPFDLYRQELMMTLKAVPDEVAESIVDEVFLPLVSKR